MSLYNKITNEGRKLLDSLEKEINNLKRYAHVWDWLEEHQYGEYLKYDDVVSLFTNKDPDNLTKHQKDVLIKNKNWNLLKKDGEMKEKTFRNSPKGRLEIPEKPGFYMLLDDNGNDVYGGWNQAVNLRMRIKEHHYDKTKHFKFIKVRRKKMNVNNIKIQKLKDI